MIGRLHLSPALAVAGLHLAAFVGLWQLGVGLEAVLGPSDFLADPAWQWLSPLLGSLSVLLGLPIFYPAVLLFGDGPLVYWPALLLNSVAWGVGTVVLLSRLRPRPRAV